jgi:hypothetical protein
MPTRMQQVVLRAHPKGQLKAGDVSVESADCRSRALVACCCGPGGSHSIRPRVWRLMGSLIFGNNANVGKLIVRVGGQGPHMRQWFSTPIVLAPT